MLKKILGEKINSKCLEIEQNIPSHGYVLAYLRSRVIFYSYQNEQELMQFFESPVEDTNSGGTLKTAGDQILELHLFDGSIECRVVYSEEKNQYLASQISDQLFMEEKEIAKELLDEHKFVEKVYLYGKEEELMDAGKGDRMEVITYFDYDERGMLYACDYRLGRVEKEG